MYWNNSDSSLYIEPYAPTGGAGYVGLIPAVPPDSEIQVNFTEQGSGDHPYVSLHERGEVHATCRSPRYRTEPVAGVPLFDPRGGHIATISCFDATGLPRLAGRPSEGPDTVDLVLQQRDPTMTRLHAVIYVANQFEEFPVEVQARVTMRRETLKEPLHFGVRLRGEPTGDDSDAQGVTVVAGWGPRADSALDQPLIYALTK